MACSGVVRPWCVLSLGLDVCYRASSRVCTVCVIVYVWRACGAPAFGLLWWAVSHLSSLSRRGKWPSRTHVYAAMATGIEWRDTRACCSMYGGGCVDRCGCCPSTSYVCAMSRSSFDVVVDGYLAYSKYVTGTLPDFAELAKLRPHLPTWAFCFQPLLCELPAFAAA